MKLLYVLILALFRIGFAMGQEDSLSQLTTEITSCRFYKHSLDMDNENKLVLEMIALDIKNRHKEGKPLSRPIILSSYYCIEEAAIDRFIGIKRAKIILDYLIKNTGLGADNFLIRDYDVQYKGNYSTVGCAYSSVSIHY